MDAVFLVYYNLLVKGNLVTQSDLEYTVFASIREFHDSMLLPSWQRSSSSFSYFSSFKFVLFLICFFNFWLNNRCKYKQNF